MANSPNLISGVGSRFMVRYTLLGQFNNLWHMHLSAQENYYVTFVCLSDDGVFTRLEYSRNSIIGKRTSDVQVTTVLGYSSTARTTDCLCNAKVQTTTKVFELRLTTILPTFCLGQYFPRGQYRPPVGDLNFQRGDLGLSGDGIFYVLLRKRATSSEKSVGGKVLTVHCQRPAQLFALPSDQHNRALLVTGLLSEVLHVRHVHCRSPFYNGVDKSPEGNVA
ncbi:hypothetical protein M513_02446 [Trichuris suis]|uniref:Uncharacterized protein n=1 Tax=Trichuris suis TaxID=68888 RepID=A0A085MHS3_9BILA|nr:hypothetical protein M513_02446 [Trichuris suis]